MTLCGNSVKQRFFCICAREKRDTLLVGQKDKFSYPYEDHAFIIFDDYEISINWKGIARRVQTNIPMGEKVGLLVSHDMLLIKYSFWNPIRINNVDQTIPKYHLSASERVQCFNNQIINDSRKAIC